MGGCFVALKKKKKALTEIFRCEYVLADKQSRYLNHFVPQVTAVFVRISIFVLFYLVGINENSGKEGQG